MSEGKRVRWTIASARQEFPTLIDMAAREPQDIYRRDELVARVVPVDTPTPSRPTAADLIARIRRSVEAENYDLPVPPRIDRPNPLVEPKPKKRTRKAKR